MSEFQFVQAVAERIPGHCVGPLVRLAISGYQLVTLEDSFRSEEAHDLLWSGFLPYGSEPSTAPEPFELCAAHWMDLSCLAGIRARQHQRSDWLEISHAVLRDTCHGARWDPKEISNLFVWRRVALT